MTVQVTPMAPKAGLWVESYGLERVVVRGERDVRFSYMVNGIRRGYADWQSIRDRSTPKPIGTPRQTPQKLEGVLAESVTRR